MNLKAWYERLFNEGGTLTFSEFFLAWSLAWAITFNQFIKELGFSAPWWFYVIPIGTWSIVPIARIIQRVNRVRVDEQKNG